MGQIELFKPSWLQVKILTDALQLLLVFQYPANTLEALTGFPS
jgi:hypothetical protein